MEIETEFNMLDELKDTVTGFKGKVLAITLYQTGCTHYSLQTPMGKDGKVAEWESFDASRLVLVKAAKPVKVKPTGGPAPKVEQW